MEFPHYVYIALEDFGIEDSDIQEIEADILINCEDFLEAYNLRNKLLEEDTHTIILYNSPTQIGNVVVRVQDALVPTQ